MSVLLERDQFLETAQKKTQVINHLVETNQVLIPRKNPQATIGNIIMHAWIRDVHVDGDENINEGLRHLNQRLTMSLNHESDGDHRGIVYGLEKSGHSKLGRDIAFRGGIKMYMRGSTRKFLGADPIIFTETPSEITEREKWKSELSAHEDFQAYEKAAGALLYRSVRESIAWQKAGKPIVLYPGATRQRGKEVISPPERVSAYVKKDMWVLPIYSIGMEKILPALQLPNVFNRTSLLIRAGACYSGEEVLELLKDSKIADAGITAADIMMARITCLNPDPHFSPEYYDKYNVLKKRDPYMQKRAN